MHPKDIAPHNNKGERHGYCEFYWGNGELWDKGIFINGHRYGYFESHDRDGSVWKYGTGYYLNGDRINMDNKEGYCYIWNRKENSLNELS